MKRIKFKLAGIIEHLFSGPDGTPPGDYLRYEFGEEKNWDGGNLWVAHTTNDGFEVGIAYNETGQWAIFMRQKAARQFAKFVLWDWWAKSTWFGLKRVIYYKVLSIVVSSFSVRQEARNEKTT